MNVWTYHKLALGVKGQGEDGAGVPLENLERLVEEGEDADVRFAAQTKLGE